MKMRLKNSSHHWYFWTGIVGLLLIEFILFQTYVHREITPFYPANFDQAGYLDLSYSLYEKTRQEGLLAQFKNGSLGFATSFSFILQTVVTFLLFGASRGIALAIGFVYFAALQLLTIKVALNVTGKRSLTLLLWGWLLSVATTFFWAGGIFDFRIDFMAACLFGMIITACIQSDIFLDKKWTTITVILSAYLILLRYITATYLFGIYFALLGYLILTCVLENKKHHPTTLIKLRIKHLLISLLAIILIIAPFLWSSWAAFYNYYVGNHVFSNEKYIRAAQVGVTNIASSLIYYPISILKDHLGPLALSLISLSLLGTFFLRKPTLQENNRAMSDLLVRTFLILCIFVPIFILTLDYSKSPVVGDITVVPILWLTLWVIHRSYKESSKKFQYFILFITTLTLICGMFHYVQTTLHRTSRLQKQNLQQITKMYLDLGYYLHAQGKDDPRYSADRIADYLVPQALATLFYEHNGILLHPSNNLLGGNNFFAINKQDAIKTLNSTNIFIVNLDTYPKVRADYPFNDCLNQFRPTLRNIAERTFIKLGDYELKGYKYRVYVKT